jgi:hypothetical protein
MAGLGGYPTLGFYVPQKVNPTAEYYVGFYTVLHDFQLESPSETKIAGQIRTVAANGRTSQN